MNRWISSISLFILAVAFIASGVFIENKIRKEIASGSVKENIAYSMEKHRSEIQGYRTIIIAVEIIGPVFLVLSYISSPLAWKKRQDNET